MHTQYKALYLEGPGEDLSNPHNSFRKSYRVLFLFMSSVLERYNTSPIRSCRNSYFCRGQDVRYRAEPKAHFYSGSLCRWPLVTQPTLSQLTDTTTATPSTSVSKEVWHHRSGRLEISAFSILQRAAWSHNRAAVFGPFTPNHFNMFVLMSTSF